MIKTVLIASVCALLALFGGLWLGGHPESLPSWLRDSFLVKDDRALRAEVTDVIRDNFYKRVDEKKLDDASLKGIVRSLDDPFSTYLTPREAGRFEEAVSGRFEGVGMSVDQDRRGLRVLNVFDDTPAKRGGIRKGDLIVAVNGRSIAGVDSELATARIKGPAGTRVRLALVRDGEPGRKELTLRRERIRVPVVEGKIVRRGGRRLGVVELLSFSQGSHGALKQEIRKLLGQGADGLVLDLRGNGGGLLEEAVLVASIFVEDGEIVSVRGRRRSERTREAKGRSIDPDVPVVVLVDRGSASASEIVAGALRDRKRARLVGTRTFGKGLVQEVTPLSNGGVLDLTVANYYLPSGATIGRKGLPPQVRARDNPDTRRDEALPIALDELSKRTR